MGGVRRGSPGLERLGAAALAILAIAFVAACGGSGDSGDTGSTAVSTTGGDATSTVGIVAAAQGGGDNALIRKTLDAVFTSGDPAAACETYVTAYYVVTAYGDLDGCKAAQTSGAAARSVEVGNLKNAGVSATATVVPSGGPSSGEKIDVILIKAGTTWQVDTAKAPNAAVGP